MGKQHTFDEDLCLQYDPFQGDETDVIGMGDKIVRAAKAHPKCHTCEGSIFKGERHRCRVERNSEERKIDTFRWCSKCCRAMALAEEFDRYEFADNERLMSSRERIGDERRRALGATP